MHPDVWRYMFRYIALIWDVEDADQCAAARFLLDRLQARARAETWGRVEQNSSLRVLHKNFRQGSLDVCVLPEQRGVLPGALFERLNDRSDDSAAPGH